MMQRSLFDGTSVPVLGLGTWGMGGKTNVDRSQDTQCVAALNYGITRGLTHIDTSEFYAQGHTEELVGQAIQSFDRKHLFLSTKVWLTNLSYDAVIRSAKESLKRLGTDYIDLYSIHKPNPDIPLQETIRALDFLKKEGLIKFIGVSNFSLPMFKEAQSYTDTGLVANQIEYNLAHRITEEERRYYASHGILVVAYKPIARGLLSEIKIKELEPLIKKYGKTAEQLALRWLLHQKNVVAIPKAFNSRHIDANIDALQFTIDEEDLHILDQLRIQLPVK